ncbi:MAG: histidine phosphatase family protein [Alphaproteobacteria bacterium]|nr:histidine phosphatase family protein [Alphaproteobacteria bacterium]
MTTTLVIARHGNTFDPGDVIRRVGAHTDLPLSESGRQQAANLGKTLAAHKLIPDIVFAAPLLRTKQTAELALAAVSCSAALQLQPQLTEIDYGPDEGKPETDVIARLGEKALRDWEEKHIVPNGWRIDPAALENMWEALAMRIRTDYADKTVLCVTSNGIARFALNLAADSAEQNTPKLATSAYGVLKSVANGWRIESWNVRP